MPLTPQHALQCLIERRDLVYEDMLHLMRLIIRGEIPPTMVAAILASLRTKQETVDEITAAAVAMREVAQQITLPFTSHLVDIVGTGGDGSQTFNISTAAMFVAAAAGAKVAKHGNRNISSQSGSADVLEALGAHLMLTADQIAACIAETGIGFMFAPNHHPAMKNVNIVRKTLGVRTLFNLLGPLTNPAGAPHQLIGVFDLNLLRLQVCVTQRLAAQHVLVVFGQDGLDEVSLGAPTMIGELRNGRIREYEICPEDFGLQRTSRDAFKVASVEASKTMLLTALENQPSAACEIVIFNAGVALYAADIVETIGEGITRARAVIKSGAARAKVDKFVQFTRACQAKAKA